MNRTLFFLVAALGASGIHAAVPEQPLTPAAEAFIKAGATTVLAACDIIARKCGDETMQTLDKGFGESNEERRNWRKMQLRTLSVTATFPVLEPTRYYIELVRIDGPGWPVPQALEIGSTKTQLTETLGPATRLDARKCAVYFSEAQIASATFCFKADQVSSISWEYLVD